MKIFIRQKNFFIYYLLIVFCGFMFSMDSPNVMAESTELLMVKLIEAGPSSAVVKYKEKEITVSKYYPRRGEPLYGASTDLSLLVSCIGSYVGALVDDKNGEILGLWCPDTMSAAELNRAMKQGRMDGIVLIVPDEYINLK
ncbi:MAG: hypothetical protein A2W53_00080 [Nitrospinae bacterium RIFCSPHIGHO2_02_39_11]|nr:MAG: hypothetical protein A2W53_00080 [Nitrospinae bacterium RIFCSPHIGHO2_02_39_11]